MHLIKATGEILCDKFQCFCASYNELFKIYYQIIQNIYSKQGIIPHLFYKLLNILLPINKINFSIIDEKL